MNKETNLALDPTVPNFPPVAAEQVQSEFDHDYLPNLVKELRGWSVGDQGSDDARRMVFLMSKAADLIENLDRNLGVRDKFIGDRELFEEFLAQLPEVI